MQKIPFLIEVDENCIRLFIGLIFKIYHFRNWSSCKTFIVCRLAYSQLIYDLIHIFNSLKLKFLHKNVKFVTSTPALSVRILKMSIY